ncbi:MAG: hypothetical protein L0Z50_35575 [Verrucomicrobiales bacterium]|nr:hypothetical protein [Verrucomicrobiales bacterium]
MATARLIWLMVLSISALANVIMVVCLISSPNAAVPILSSTETPVRSDAQLLTRDGNKTPFSSDSTQFHWGDFVGLDFRGVRDRLRVMGCPEHTAQAILATELQLEYGPRLRALYREQADDFWDTAVLVKTPRNPSRTPEQDEARRAYESLSLEMSALATELLGRDWRHRGRDRYDDSSASDPRINFLSEEKRNRVVEQRKAISDLRHELRSQGTPEKEVQSHVEALEAEQNHERAQFLSSEELEEFRLRTSKQAYIVSNLYGFEPTREEIREILKLKEAHSGKVPDEHLRSLLGDERFTQFQRAQDPAFHAIYKVGSHVGIAADQMVQAYDWKRQAEATAKLIRANRDMPLEGRRSALEALRSQAEAEAAVHLGESGRAIYRRNGGWWIDGLAALEN